MLSRLIPTCRIRPFGSTINGFGRFDCDLDMAFEYYDCTNISQVTPQKLYFTDDRPQQVFFTYGGNESRNKIVSGLLGLFGLFGCLGISLVSIATTNQICMCNDLYEPHSLIPNLNPNVWTLALAHNLGERTNLSWANSQAWSHGCSAKRGPTVWLYNMPTHEKFEKDVFSADLLQYWWKIWFWLDIET